MAEGVNLYSVNILPTSRYLAWLLWGRGSWILTSQTRRAAWLGQLRTPCYSLQPPLGGQGPHSHCLPGEMEAQRLSKCAEANKE